MELQGTQKFNDYQQAISNLPKDYVSIDENFLARYEVEIEAIKEFLDDKGGLHLIQVDEYSTLCRVPSKETLSKVSDRSKKLDPIEADIDFVNRCLVYPSSETFSGWINKGAPGLASSISRKIFDLAKLNQEAVSKKL
ncbi:hypothetical protein LEP1GSC079_1135 [Leptospira interrogans str. FPW1039]|uniref:Uncharacterized protein n=1 Tax=Leptospira interrogans str. FPW1039 TaxID=1193040 RepID=A0A0F6ILH8_LEPIR|nr:hypothetical protein [Leptospira interrogans]EMJ38903.1 hypothetical protein LEP1GSC079_1135 [Leptospira interrogans str. FPW1039]